MAFYCLRVRNFLCFLYATRFVRTGIDHSSLTNPY